MADRPEDPSIPLLKALHLRHVRRVLDLAFRSEMWTTSHAVFPIMSEFWADDDDALAAKADDYGVSGWVEAIRVLEVQRREMMRRAPMLGELATAHDAARSALEDVTERLAAVESAAYGTMMELVDS